MIRYLSATFADYFYSMGLIFPDNLRCGNRNVFQCQLKQFDWSNLFSHVRIQCIYYHYFVSI